MSFGRCVIVVVRRCFRLARECTLVDRSPWRTALRWPLCVVMRDGGYLLVVSRWRQVRWSSSWYQWRWLRWRVWERKRKHGRTWFYWRLLDCQLWHWWNVLIVVCLTACWLSTVCLFCCLAELFFLYKIYIGDVMRSMQCSRGHRVVRSRGVIQMLR